MSTPPETAAGEIVVGVDDSDEALSALRWAANLSTRRRKRLKVVHAFQPRHLAAVFGMAKLQPDDEWRVEALHWLEEFVGRVVDDSADAELDPKAAPGDPAAVLLSAVDAAELLVVGSRGHGRAVGALLGSVSGSVLTQAPCPVAVVRGPVPGASVELLAPASPEESTMRVLVGVDDSAEAAPRHEPLSPCWSRATSRWSTLAM